MSGAKHERNHGGEQEWCGYMKGEDVSYGDASDKDLRFVCNVLLKLEDQKEDKKNITQGF